MTATHQILVGDCIDMMRTLPDQSVQCCVTSPPYFGLRDYGVDGQIGLEQTPAEFIGRLVDVFREVRRVLRNDGTAWVNMGDSYASKRYASRRSTAQRQSVLVSVTGLTQLQSLARRYRLAGTLQSVTVVTERFTRKVPSEPGATVSSGRVRSASRSYPARTKVRTGRIGRKAPGT